MEIKFSSYSVSTLLGKEFFVECPTKNIQESVEHLAKSQISIVNAAIVYK
jgi:hypothetical protein